MSEIRLHKVFNSVCGLRVLKICSMLIFTASLAYHKSEAETLAHEVRNWFRESGLKSVPPGSVVWADFNAFMSDFEIKREAEG